MQHIWTEAEENFLRASYRRLSDTELAAALTRAVGKPISKKAVEHHRKKLGLGKTNTGTSKKRPKNF